MRGYSVQVEEEGNAEGRALMANVFFGKIPWPRPFTTGCGSDDGGDGNRIIPRERVLLAS